MIRRRAPASAFILLLFVSCAGVPTGRSTALHDAAGRGDVAALQDLLSEESKVDARDEEGRTALHRAAMAGDVLAAAALLDAGADPDLTDREGRSPLHYAVLACDSDLVAMILGAEARSDIRDDADEDPLDLARRTGCDAAVDTILSSITPFE